jgi:hypothetical protein
VDCPAADLDFLSHGEREAVLALAAEADATDGDIRKVLFALLEQAALAYAALPSANKPAKMVVSRSTNLRSDGNLDRTYTFAFELAPASVDVADEA